MVDKKITIVMWGTYDTGKPRVRILHNGICSIGTVQLIECKVNIWEELEDKRRADAWDGITNKNLLMIFCSKLAFMLRLLACYPKLIFRYLKLPPHDIVLISYPGLLDVLVIRLFAWLRKVPVVWDVFISMYDTVVCDRRIIGRRHPGAKLLWLLEWLAVKSADIIFMDTQSHARRLRGLFNLPIDKCGVVFVGVEAGKFTPPQRGPRKPGPLRVLFYGQFIPLHGIEYIIEAARLLKNENVEWIIIGKGQESPRIRKMLLLEPLPRMRWIEWVDYSKLINWIVSADICLGIFGTSEKAANVIPNKVYQVISAQRPLITRDSPAIRELLKNSPPCTYLIPEGDAYSLAGVVKRHAEVIRKEIMMCCHADIIKNISANAIGAQFFEAIKNLGMKF